MKALNQSDAHANENGSHDNGAKNAPKQHAMLVAPIHAEIGENQQEDEEVVDAEGLFDEIPSQELQSFDGSLPKIDPQVEQQRQADPNTAPNKRLADADSVRAAVKNSQIEHQHEDHKGAKTNPQQKLTGHE